MSEPEFSAGFHNDNRARNESYYYSYYGEKKAIHESVGDHCTPQKNRARFAPTNRRPNEEVYDRSEARDLRRLLRATLHDFSNCFI